MKLHRPVVAALALFVALPALGLADADAAFIRRSVVKTVTNQNGSTYNRVIVVVGDDNTTASVAVELESDAGDEELTLVETDAWLHGAATISALPAADADLTVTLYDAGNAALKSFSGTLGADGSVTLTAEDAKYDIELLASEVFTAEKGYDLTVDLAGADAYDVAYASITVTEGGAVCLATDEKGNCLKWDTTKEVSTRSELYWDDIGSVWEADTTIAHEGLIELKASTLDSRGKKIETAKAKLGMPWLDEGEGVGTLATDEDPLTRLALHPRHLGANQHWHAMSPVRALTVVSEGWSAGDDIPADAAIELTNGETITIPVNSYQRVPRKVDFYRGPDFPSILEPVILKPGSSVSITSGSVAFQDLSLADLSEPVCSGGVCVVLVEDEEYGLALSFGVYASDAGELPEELELEVVLHDADGAEVVSDALFLTFDDEITAVFANEVSFASDPVGLGLSGKVSLLGAPNRKGKQETLAKGKFYAELTRDGDGDLELGGGDKDEVVSSGNVVVSGAAIDLGDEKTGLDAPPVIVYGVMGNGSGTKNAHTTVSARPQLL